MTISRAPEAERLRVPAWFPRGMALLHDPTLNKGTAFNAAERDLPRYPRYA